MLSSAEAGLWARFDSPCCLHPPPLIRKPRFATSRLAQWGFPATPNTRRPTPATTTATGHGRTTAEMKDRDRFNQGRVRSAGSHAPPTALYAPNHRPSRRRNAAGPAALGNRCKRATSTRGRPSLSREDPELGGGWPRGRPRTEDAVERRRAASSGKGSLEHGATPRSLKRAACLAAHLHRVRRTYDHTSRMPVGSARVQDARLITHVLWHKAGARPPPAASNAGA